MVYSVSNSKLGNAVIQEDFTTAINNKDTHTHTKRKVMDYDQCSMAKCASIDYL